MMEGTYDKLLEEGCTKVDPEEARIMEEDAPARRPLRRSATSFTVTLCQGSNEPMNFRALRALSSRALPLLHKQSSVKLALEPVGGQHTVSWEALEVQMGPRSQSLERQREKETPFHTKALAYSAHLHVVLLKLAGVETNRVPHGHTNGAGATLR